jgi:hypothetical protein
VKSKFAAALVAAFVVGGAQAQVEVKDAWARPTVPGQNASGAFMTITAKDGARLVGVASAVAGIAEVHEMAMEGNVMRMRAVSSLDIPAGRPVELKPGGYHVMLLDLKRPLAPGQRITLDLRFELNDERLITQPVVVEVAAGQPKPAAADSHKH